MTEQRQVRHRQDELDIFASNRVRLADERSLDELRGDVMRAAYQRRDVTLDSGVTQPYYFDKYLLTARPAILRRLARFLASRVPLDADRIAAPTLGAVVLGTAVSLESGLPLSIIRTHLPPRALHGQRDVEGGIYRGEVVCLVEDVVVTGSRAAIAIERLRSVGGVVTSVVSVVDCERSADVRLRELGIDYMPLFRYSSLIREGRDA
jgi:orotate phosphoribosyltransferase